MPNSALNYFPLALPFILALVFLIGLLILLIEIGILRYAYEKMGVSPRYVFTVLILSLLGSYVNIPVAELPAKEMLSNQETSFFGIRYVIPLVEERPRTIVAVNLGGAVIPVFISIYLMMKHTLYRRGLLGIAVVAVVVHWLAEPIRGVGIAIPVFVPPVVSAFVALLLSRKSAPPLAYIIGSLGTLIGADLLNLWNVQGLGAPIISIGGAGTFDGIFMTGILAVLIA